MEYFFLSDFSVVAAFCTDGVYECSHEYLVFLYKLDIFKTNMNKRTENCNIIKIIPMS